MRRSALAIAIATLAALLSTASAWAAPGDAPKLRAVVTSCETGADAASRAASFTGSMPVYGDTARMAMRFDLQQRTADGGVWQRVDAPSFGRWERSRPGVAGFVYAKDVHGLAAPGEYRAVVRFRWYAQDGTVRNVRKLTRSCKQPDPRPSITVGRISVGPSGMPGLATYLVLVRNAGRTVVGPFVVTIALDGAEVGRAGVPGLAPGATTWVQIAAAPMAVERLTAVATLESP